MDVYMYCNLWRADRRPNIALLYVHIQEKCCTLVKLLPYGVLENSTFFSKNTGSLLDRFSSKIIFLSFRSGGFKKIESSIFTQVSIFTQLRNYILWKVPNFIYHSIKMHHFGGSSELSIFQVYFWQFEFNRSHRQLHFDWHRSCY